MYIFYAGICVAVVFFILIWELIGYIETIGGRAMRLSAIYDELKPRTKKLQEEQPKGGTRLHLAPYVFEICICVGACLIVVFLTGSMWISITAGICSYAFLRIIKKHLHKHSDEKFLEQYARWLLTIKGSIKAGMSLEEAIIDSRLKEKKKTGVRGKHDKIGMFIDEMIDSMSYGCTVIQVLCDFARSSHFEEVADFATAVRVTSQKGGNLVEVIESVYKLINEKLTMKREIVALLAGKRLEGKIVAIVPIALVMLMCIMSPQYMEVLITTLAGKAVICICMILITAGFYTVDRITDID